MQSGAIKGPSCSDMIPRGSKHPMFKDSGPQNRQGCGI